MPRPFPGPPDGRSQTEFPVNPRLQYAALAPVSRSYLESSPIVQPSPKIGERCSADSHPQLRELDS